MKEEDNPRWRRAHDRREADFERAIQEEEEKLEANKEMEESVKVGDHQGVKTDKEETGKKKKKEGTNIEGEKHKKKRHNKEDEG